MIVRFVGKVTHFGMFNSLCMTISCLYRVYVTYLSHGFGVVHHLPVHF